MNEALAHLILFTVAVPVTKDFTAEYGVVVQDLEQHCVQCEQMRDPKDIANWAHEAQHMVSAESRERQGKGIDYNSFYLLRGEAMLVKEPPFKITDIKVTTKGPNYHLYFRVQPFDQWYQGFKCEGWNNRPLYIMDEAFAFTTGFEAALKAGLKDESRRDNMMEFVGYVNDLVDTARRLDCLTPEIEAAANYNYARAQLLNYQYQVKYQVKYEGRH